MERAVPYKSLRYIRELAEAGKPQEIRALRLQCGRATSNKKEVLEEVAQSFRSQHNQGKQELSGITRRMVRALPRVFTAEQSEDIHCSRVTLGEIKDAVKALKGEKSPGVDQLVAVKKVPTRTSPRCAPSACYPSSKSRVQNPKI